MRAKPPIAIVFSLVWLLASLAGCQNKGQPASPAAPAKDAVEAPAKAPVVEPGQPKLHGTAPPVAKRTPAPAFAARNRDGSARGQADLLGHKTILWFYPKASTPG